MASIKRNSPCPCGSGRKYKKCCGKASQNSFPASLDSLIEGFGEALLGTLWDGKRPSYLGRLLSEHMPIDGHVTLQAPGSFASTPLSCLLFPSRTAFPFDTEEDYFSLVDERLIEPYRGLFRTICNTPPQPYCCHMGSQLQIHSASCANDPLKNLDAIVGPELPEGEYLSFGRLVTYIRRRIFFISFVIFDDGTAIEEFNEWLYRRSRHLGSGSASYGIVTEYDFTEHLYSLYHDRFEDWQDFDNDEDIDVDEYLELHAFSRVLEDPRLRNLRAYYRHLDSIDQEAISHTLNLKIIDTEGLDKTEHWFFLYLNFPEEPEELLQFLIESLMVSLSVDWRSVRVLHPIWVREALAVMKSKEEASFIINFVYWKLLDLLDYVAIYEENPSELAAPIIEEFLDRLGVKQNQDIRGSEEESLLSAPLSILGLPGNHPAVAEYNTSSALELALKKALLTPDLPEAQELVESFNRYREEQRFLALWQNSGLDTKQHPRWRYLEMMHGIGRCFDKRFLAMPVDRLNLPKRYLTALHRALGDGLEPGALTIGHIPFDPWKLMTYTGIGKAMLEKLPVAVYELAKTWRDPWGRRAITKPPAIVSNAKEELREGLQELEALFQASPQSPDTD